jgi:CelD/BcsL family acetyltransferase involved in cellulose biosynthesis
VARGAFDGVIVVRISGVPDFGDLGARWRDLEQRAAGSFFQSWTWVGCCCADRFPDPVLVEATEDGRTVALGLFNRIRRWGRPPAVYLAETGTAELDCPYVEQNGILTAAGREKELTLLCLQPLLRGHDVVLSGVKEQVLAATRCVAGLLINVRQQNSPFVDLAAIRCSGGGYLAGRSANTRQQLRRSDRFYEREGAIRLEPACSVESAHAMLRNMAELHQAVWLGRGKPGSFGLGFFNEFHHALVETGWPRGEVVLLEISSGETVIGYLYNFVWQNRMSAYQSGFVYRDRQSQAKPGLTCHHAAIRFALDQGFNAYDFLAGEDRYKRSLDDRSHRLFWLQAGPKWSPSGWLGLCRKLFQRRSDERSVRKHG